MRIEGNQKTRATPQMYNNIVSLKCIQFVLDCGLVLIVFTYIFRCYFTDITMNSCDWYRANETAMEDMSGYITWIRNITTRKDKKPKYIP